MADLSQTAADVAIDGSTSSIQTVQAGEAITQGMPVCRYNGKYFAAHADLNGGTTAQDQAYAGSDVNAMGIALTPASGDGAYFAIVKPGARVDIGATLTVGEVYIISSTPGAVAPLADFSGYTNAYCTPIGVGVTGAIMKFQPIYSGATNAS